MPVRLVSVLCENIKWGGKECHEKLWHVLVAASGQL